MNESYLRIFYVSKVKDPEYVFQSVYVIDNFKELKVRVRGDSDFGGQCLNSKF